MLFSFHFGFFHLKTRYETLLTCSFHMYLASFHFCFVAFFAKDLYRIQFSSHFSNHPGFVDVVHVVDTHIAVLCIPKTWEKECRCGVWNAKN